MLNIDKTSIKNIDTRHGVAKKEEGKDENHVGNYIRKNPKVKEPISSRL